MPDLQGNGACRNRAAPLNRMASRSKQTGAQPFTVFSWRMSPPRASAVAHARPLCPLAPARHRRFANVPPGVPFATPARESRRALLECHRANPTGHDVQRFSGAQVSAGKPRRCATRRRKVLCVSRGLADRASGQLSLRSRAALLLRETVRPHFALQDLIDTLPPSSAHYACR